VYVIIIGCGQIGYQLTRALLSADNEVVVIERDSRRAEAATEQMGSVVIASDGTEPSVLREAGAGRCDVLVATTGSDADNLVACQVAKASFNVPRTVAVVHDPQHVSLFDALGVDVTISTTSLILSHIEEELPSHPLVHLLSLKGQHQQVVGIRIPADSVAVGRAVSDVPMPPGTAVALIVGKDGGIRTLDRELHFEAEDEVVAITLPEYEEQLWHALTSGK
jgi:trk system potassium uptake protein TrkA